MKVSKCLVHLKNSFQLQIHFWTVVPRSSPRSNPFDHEVKSVKICHLILAIRDYVFAPNDPSWIWPEWNKGKHSTRNRIFVKVIWLLKGGEIPLYSQISLGGDKCIVIFTGKKLIYNHISRGHKVKGY